VVFRSLLLFQTGDHAYSDVWHDVDVLEDPFEIRPGVIIPAGSYGWTRVAAVTSFNESRTFSGGGYASFGNFYNGERTTLGGRLTWKTGKHLTLSGTMDRNDFSLPLPGGDFSTTIIGLDVLGALSRKLFANALFQYDNDSETIQSNVRINWIHTPGSNLFLVFDTGYHSGDQLDPRESRWVRRTGIVKLTYLKAF
jgi:hypothetical protein